MDFVTRLPTIFYKDNAKWVIADWLTKFAHFILIRLDFLLSKHIKLNIKEIIKLHRVTSSIMSDRDPQFTF